MQSHSFIESAEEDVFYARRLFQKSLDSADNHTGGLGWWVAENAAADGWKSDGVVSLGDGQVKAVGDRQLEAVPLAASTVLVHGTHGVKDGFARQSSWARDQDIAV